MIFRSNDSECQEYIENELLAVSFKKDTPVICEGELKTAVAVIHSEADELLAYYLENGVICEVCLKRLELAINLLRETVDRDK